MVVWGRQAENRWLEATPIPTPPGQAWSTSIPGREQTSTGISGNERPAAVTQAPSTLSRQRDNKREDNQHLPGSRGGHTCWQGGAGRLLCNILFRSRGSAAPWRKPPPCGARRGPSWGAGVAPGAPLGGCTQNRPAVPEQKPGCKERHGRMPTYSSLQSCGLLGSQESAGVTTRSCPHGKTVFIWEKKRILKELSCISICQSDSCPLGHSPENSHSGLWPNLQKTLSTNQVLNNALIQRDYTGRPQRHTLDGQASSFFEILTPPVEKTTGLRTRPRPGEGRRFPAAVPATLISAEARRYSPATPSRPSALGRV